WQARAVWPAQRGTGLWRFAVCPHKTGPKAYASRQSVQVREVVARRFQPDAGDRVFARKMRCRESNLGWRASEKPNRAVIAWRPCRERMSHEPLTTDRAFRE